MVTALPEQVAPVTVVVMGECEARKAGYKAGYGRLCGSKLHLATAGYCLFLHGSKSIGCWSLCSQTSVSEKRLGFFWLVVIPLDHLWLVPLTLMEFQRPFGQLANIALELENVQGIGWIWCLVAIQRFVIESILVI